MPDAGFDGDGWFANWFNGGAGGQPMWETFHAEQAIPWIGYLLDVGIGHSCDYYGGGTHIFAYLARDLPEYVGPMMRRFRHAPRRPRTIGYLTTDARWR
jgi:hypothetical protein